MQYNTVHTPVSSEEEFVSLSDEDEAKKLSDAYKRHGLDEPVYMDDVVGDPLDELRQMLG